MSKQRKLLYLIVGSSAVIIMALIVFLVVNLRRNATLDLLVAPLSAEITVNGVNYENGVYKFEPGEVEIKIYMEGFESKEEKIVLEPNTTTKYYTYLMPTDGSFKWYLEHEEDMMILNTIGDAEANVNATNYLEKYPIVDALPIIYANYDKEWNYTEFRVDGGKFNECKEAFCLKITDTTGGNKDSALKMIRDKGFNPEDYEIIYQYEPILPLND